MGTMLSFKEYLTEAPQQGFKYEENVVDVLKPLGFVPSYFIPAGAGHDQPDLMLLHNGIEAGCELKISAASAGSLVMKKVAGIWMVGKQDEKDEEKLFISQLAEELGIIDMIEKKWKADPYKFTQDPKIKEEVEGLDKRQIYSAELKRFPEIKGKINPTKIEEYYNKKKTYYVNVGTHGFYLLGKKNPLKLKGIPTFGSAASAGFRARVQAKGGGTYQFTFEMSFSIKSSSKSPYNIGPVSGKSVQIVQSKLSLPFDQ